MANCGKGTGKILHREKAPAAAGLNASSHGHGSLGAPLTGRLRAFEEPLPYLRSKKALEPEREAEEYKACVKKLQIEGHV